MAARGWLLVEVGRAHSHGGGTKGQLNFQAEEGTRWMGRQGEEGDHSLAGTTKNHRGWQGARVPAMQRQGRA